MRILRLEISGVKAALLSVSANETRNVTPLRPDFSISVADEYARQFSQVDVITAERTRDVRSGLRVITKDYGVYARYREHILGHESRSVVRLCRYTIRSARCCTAPYYSVRVHLPYTRARYS